MNDGSTEAQLPEETTHEVLELLRQERAAASRGNLAPHRAE
jgi:hypothetical protein